jgi:hypothetical protein
VHRRHHLGDGAGVGVGVEQWRQGGRDAVAQRQVGELFDAGDREVGVEELVDDLEDCGLLAEHGGECVEFGRRRPAARHRPVGLVDVDEAGRQADGAGVEAHAQEVGHRTGLLVPSRGRCWASAPITNMRSTEWPTSGATLSAMFPARASSHPPKPSPHRQSTPASNAASGISSISRNIRLNASR